MDFKGNIIDRLLENRILRHSLFWIVVTFFAPLFSEYMEQDLRTAFIMRAVNIPLKILATYLLVYYQIPKLLQKKQYFLFTLSFIVSTYVITLLYRINNVYVAETLIGDEAYKEPIWLMIYQWKYTLWGYFFRAYFVAFVFLFIKIVKDHFAEKGKMEILLKEKAQTELNFLKAQIHPHFLFNTLNNLYALTLEKSDQAPEVVAKLSEILDYMLYQCNDGEVLVSKEVELIQHYIDLERLRYGERLELCFHHQQDDPQVKIAPLVLLSIVENAFKHGVSGALQKPVVNVNLQVKDCLLTFEVFNTKSKIIQKDERAYRKGIGIANVKRQLDLEYPGRYQWLVDEKEDTYQVLLSIELCKK